MLDLYSGPNAPLAKAFNWCGWRVVTPVDLERDAELDISRPEVRQAIAGCLPQTSCIASAMSFATKSRARERQPGPPPLRSVEFPRGLPDLSNHNLLRVSQDNFSSDYAIALQHWGHKHGLACFRENPLRSLHWDDPIMKCLFILKGVGVTLIMMLVCFWVLGRHRDFVTTSLSFFHYPT